MSMPVPTLSSSGWVRSLSEKCDFLLAHFFVSDRSQSFLFNNVASLQWLIQNYQGDIAGLCSGMQTALEKYLGAYFDLAIVTVTSDANTFQNPSSLVNVDIVGTITEGGVQYSFGEQVNDIMGKAKRVITFNNTGVLT